MPSREFLICPAVPWRVQHDLADLALFKSKEDAELFARIEKIPQSRMTAIVRERIFLVNYRNLQSDVVVEVFFKEEWHAQAFATAKRTSGPSLTPRTRLPAGALESIWAAEKYVREARLEFEPVRTKLKALARDLNGVDMGERANNFIAAVLDYFPDGNLQMRRCSSGATNVLKVLEAVWGQTQESATASWLNELICEVIWLLRELEHEYRARWDKVSQCYASFTMGLIARS